MEEITHKALSLDKYSIAQLITLFENPAPELAARRQEVLAILKERPVAPVIGFTGTPGAGKSTLIGRLSLLLRSRSNRTLAVLAVDPSSGISGGSILGDRTRMRFPVDDKGLFFRSQATQGELGGMGRNTFQVTRLLTRLFDYLFLETVGIGQNEVEIQHSADFVFLVLQPLGGDAIQFMKAGIMEIPDAIILNKADQKEAARKSYQELKGSLKLSQPEKEIQVLLTSAQDGSGLAEILSLLPASGNRARNEEYFFCRWLESEYGRRGLAFYQLHKNELTGSFEEKQLAFARAYDKCITTDAI